MSLPIATAAICFIACHGGPADHFATYTDALKNKGHEVQIYATGPALQKFNDKKIDVYGFDLDSVNSEKNSSLAKEIAKACASASVVITDVGHLFDIELQKAFQEIEFKNKIFAYYDNPEAFVPGGYSFIASQVMHYAQGILFANANLAHEKIYSEVTKEVNLQEKTCIGIGYYPIQQAEEIKGKRLADRLDHSPLSIRSKFFADHKIEDKGQKILIYFGGNNTEYFDKAFPAFLSFVNQAKDYFNSNNFIIVLQQHPGAKQLNVDGQQLVELQKELSNHSMNFSIIKSTFPSTDAQILVDIALYHQTSMGPLFTLAAIPTIQASHETYADILVKNHLAPSVTTANELINALEDVEKNKQDLNLSLIYDRLGIKNDWEDVLEKTLIK